MLLPLVVVMQDAAWRRAAGGRSASTGASDVQRVGALAGVMNDVILQCLLRADSSSTSAQIDE